MQEYIHNNKFALLNIKIKYKWFLILTFILFTFLLSSTICIKTYDTYKYTGIVKNGQIILNVESADIIGVLDSDFIKIGSKKLKFSIRSVSGLQYDNYTKTNYQTIIISVTKSYIDNASVELTFYNNKQRIITKLFNLLK